MVSSFSSELAKSQRFINLSLEVQNRISEAARTIRNMPPESEVRYLSAAERCSWPSVVQDWQAYGFVKAALPRIPPTAKEIDRMSEVIGWIAWLASQAEHEAAILWASFGERKRTKALAAAKRVSRETIRRWKKSGTERLVMQFSGQIL